MSSRLGSLLVRDGVIGVKRMEKAFQRQVLFGGALDTILLEMKEVSEQRLLQYLSLATGLPPASRAEIDRLEPSAVDACPHDVAHRFRVAPLSFDGDALRVLTRDPVKLDELEDLASELGVAVQPFVAPEFRFELVFDRAYGRKSDSRFLRIAGAVDDESPVAPIGRAESVVVESALAAGSETTPVATEPVTPALARSALAARGEAARAAARAAALPAPGQPAGSRRTLVFSGIAIDRPREMARSRPPSVPDGIVGEFEAELTPPEITMELPPELGGGVVQRFGPSDTQRVPFTPEHARGSEIASGEIPEGDAPGTLAGPGAKREAGPVVTGGMETAPISAAEAQTLLERADHRDEVFEILLRAIRARAWYAAVLTVQGGAAIGRLALAGDEIDQSAIAQVLIPLDTPSSFKQAVDTGSPYIGPVAAGDSEIDAMIRRMGGVVPPAAMVLPISLKSRVVALLIGHRGADSLRVNEMSELLPLAEVAADALGRIIRRGKNKGKGKGVAGAPARAAPAEAVPEAVEDAPTGKRSDAEERFDGQMSRLSRSDVSRTGSIDELMERVQAADERIAEAAMGEALGRGAELLSWLAGNFPGVLKVDRFELGGRHLRPAQHGAVLDLVVRLGPAAASLLIEKIRDTHREIRYYAVLCASELRPEGAAVPLVERLFDSDHGIRELAIEGLSGYPFRSLQEALEIPRRALHGEDLERLQTAATALAALADVRAIPELLDVHGRGGEAGRIVGAALIGLTKQDFGLSNKKWRQWWDRNRRKNRVEWLLEGLAHKAPEIRRSAADDLRKATGEYFGYHHDLPRRERELARQRWLDWWNQTGRLRFLPEEQGERHRPTAQLPPRR